MARPKNTDPTQPVPLRLTASTVAWLDDEAASRGITRTAVARLCIERVQRGTAPHTVPAPPVRTLPKPPGAVTPKRHHLSCTCDKCRPPKKEGGKSA